MAEEDATRVNAVPMSRSDEVLAGMAEDLREIRKVLPEVLTALEDLYAAIDGCEEVDEEGEEYDVAGLTDVVQELAKKIGKKKK